MRIILIVGDNKVDVFECARPEELDKFENTRYYISRHFGTEKALLWEKSEADKYIEIFKQKNYTINKIINLNELPQASEQEFKNHERALILWDCAGIC